MNLRSTVVLGLSMVLSACAAQSQQKVDVFGGYQYARPDGGPNLNGWNTAVTRNLNKHFGITADLSGTYGGGGSMYTFAFGPQVSGKASAVKPFAHALFGGVRLGPSGFTTTAFAVLVGGGFDIGSGRLAWRAVQADWMITHVAGFTDKNNVRVSTGLVFRF